MTAGWHLLAACRDEDPDLFFPEREDASDAGSYLAARMICNRCPVRAECLATALAEERGRGASYRHGMFGGLTPGERARRAQTLWHVG